MKRAFISSANLDQASPELVARALDAQNNRVALRLGGFSGLSTLEGFYVHSKLMKINQSGFFNRKKSIQSVHEIYTEGRSMPLSSKTFNRHFFVSLMQGFRYFSLGSESS